MPVRQTEASVYTGSHQNWPGGKGSACKEVMVYLPWWETHARQTKGFFHKSIFRKLQGATRIGLSAGVNVGGEGQRLQGGRGIPALVRDHSRRTNACCHNSRKLQGATRVCSSTGVNVGWEGQRLQGGHGEPVMVRVSTFQLFPVASYSGMSLLERALCELSSYLLQLL